MTDQIDNVLHENRVFAPSAEFAATASLTAAEYQIRYERSLQDPNGFWGEVAADLTWMKPWTQVLDWQEPHAQWFAGGQTNIAFNALDRNVAQGLGNKRAMIWEGEDGEVRTLTYSELLAEVKRAANALTRAGCGGRRPRDAVSAPDS